MSAAAIAQGRAGTDVQPGLHRTVVVAALGVGIYLAALDISIVNAILPVVADAFATDLTAIQWVVTSYLLVQSALLLAVGRLADLWGHKRIYLLGLTVFIVSSVICGLASSTPFLVAGRAIQALGASLIFASLTVILTHAFPSDQRGRAVGLQATIVYVGLATGAPRRQHSSRAGRGRPGVHESLDAALPARLRHGRRRGAGRLRWPEGVPADHADRLVELEPRRAPVHRRGRRRAVRGAGHADGTRFAGPDSGRPLGIGPGPAVCRDWQYARRSRWWNGRS